MHDVCVIAVADDNRRQLGAALASLLERADGLDLDAVVVDRGRNGLAQYVEDNFAGVRTIECAPRGIGHARNRALETVEARYALFLDPGLEVWQGSLGALIAALDSRPQIGLAGVRQLRGDGSLVASMRRFPSALHMLAEALGIAQVPGARTVLGERELDPRQYEGARACDWISGCTVVRIAALERVGWFDERFLPLAEDADLCMRLSRAGWTVAYLPRMTMRRQTSDDRGNARFAAQAAYARMQFARKHFPGVAADYRWALAFRYALRLVLYSLPRRYRRERRRAARAALATVLRGSVPSEGSSAL
jgi:GT2 family glycosyltransferase